MDMFRGDPRISGKKVLLLNGCSKFRFFVSTALSYVGTNVIEAKCGCELSKKIKEEKPDIIIIDKDTPEIDVLETLKNLLKENDVSGCGVLMTAFNYETKKILKNEPLIEANLLGRPFTTKELLTKVTEIIEKSSLNAKAI